MLESRKKFRWGVLLGLRHLDFDTVAVEIFHQLSGFVHFPNNVAAADKFTLHIELGNSWPVGKDLDALPDIGVIKDVDALEGNAEIAEHLDADRRKAALRKDPVCLS